MTKKKYRIEKPEIFLLSILAITIIIIVLTNLSLIPKGSVFISYVAPLLQATDPNIIYAIVFISVILANASIFIYIPYPLILIAACQAKTNLIILTLVASIGAAIGELTGYIVGIIGDKSLSKNQKITANLEKLREYADKNKGKVYFLIFVYALTPLPDDIVMIPLGLMRFGFWRSFIFCFLGKLLLIIAIMLSAEFLGAIIISTGYSIWGDIIVLWIIAIIIYTLMKIDLEKIINT